MNGDEELIKEKKQEMANMCMSRYFDSREDQQKLQDKYHDHLRNQAK